jgi:hypothetical protein
VGTLPIQIRDFAEALERGETAADCLEAALRAAETDLAAFAHPPILTTLKASPDGVSTDLFDNVYHNQVYLAQPKDVGGAMKASRAVVYLPSGEYRPATRAHRTALLERWNPKE